MSMKENKGMLESKIDLTSRLRREGRWGEASLYKDRVISELRAGGAKKTEAAIKAWAMVAERFPPLQPVKPLDEVDKMINMINAAVECGLDTEIFDEIQQWERAFSVKLPDDDARYTLAEMMIAHHYAGAETSDS
jgi:hypothetical protein